MIDPLVLVAFLPAALALNLTPGADMMLCLAQGLRGGTRAALAASAGVAAGGMVNVTLAGIGLGALVTSLPWLFGVIRWGGVAYLIWLAIRTLRTSLHTHDAPDISPSRAFRDGMIVNLSNPKVILFILAFIPQFLDPGRALLPQFLIFGAILAIGGFLINGTVGYFACSIGQAVTKSTRLDRMLRYISAGVFGALAAKLAWEAHTT